MTQLPEDLNNLIHQAQTDVSARKPYETPAPKEPPNRLPIALILLATAVFIWGWHLWGEHISDDQIAKDANDVLVLAKAAVDREVTETGRLPAKLPDATLSAVVGYVVITSSPPVYELSLDINGNSVTLRSE